jgi:hypothetical protein
MARAGLYLRKRRFQMEEPAMEDDEASEWAAAWERGPRLDENELVWAEGRSGHLHSGKVGVTSWP